MKNHSADCFRFQLEILLREAKTQKALANRLNVSVSSVKSWLGVLRIPTIRKLDAIADRLKCATFELIMRGSLSYSYTDRNDSHIALCRNLKKHFIEQQCFSV
ncbi:MAG: helix-turn-helix domain-containing protein, partial [Clostridiales bacterium]|nr:helix-turn-helix domain-containing protein [Clostridiales bacterium]